MQVWVLIVNDWLTRPTWPEYDLTWPISVLTWPVSDLTWPVSDLNWPVCVLQLNAGMSVYCEWLIDTTNLTWVWPNLTHIWPDLTCVRPDLSCILHLIAGKSVNYDWLTNWHGWPDMNRVWPDATRVWPNVTYICAYLGTLVSWRQPKPSTLPKWMISKRFGCFCYNAWHCFVIYR